MIDGQVRQVGAAQRGIVETLTSQWVFQRKHFCRHVTF